MKRLRAHPSLCTFHHGRRPLSLLVLQSLTSTFISWKRRFGWLGLRCATSNCSLSSLTAQFHIQAGYLRLFHGYVMSIFKEYSVKNRIDRRTVRICWTLSTSSESAGFALLCSRQTSARGDSNSYFPRHVPHSRTQSDVRSVQSADFPTTSPPSPPHPWLQKASEFEKCRVMPSHPSSLLPRRF